MVIFHSYLSFPEGHQSSASARCPKRSASGVPRSRNSRRPWQPPRRRGHGHIQQKYIFEKKEMKNVWCDITMYYLWYSINFMIFYVFMYIYMYLYKIIDIVLKLFASIWYLMIFDVICAMSVSIQWVHRMQMTMKQNSEERSSDTRCDCRWWQSIRCRW